MMMTLTSAWIVSLMSWNLHFSPKVGERGKKKMFSNCGRDAILQQRAMAGGKFLVG